MAGARATDVEGFGGAPRANPWRKALVLGGIRSGKSKFAESLVACAPSVRYVATARRAADDPEWEARIEAHRARRPASWVTDEVGDDPLALLDVISGACPQDTLLVDDLGTWIAGLITMPAGTQSAVVSRLAHGVAACRATLVLVSAEVGLSVVPATPAARAFADALGTANQAVAAQCDTVVLVVAGNAVPVKGAL